MLHHATAAPAFSSRSSLRKAIIRGFRRPEEECVRALTPDATLNAAEREETTKLATRLTTALRADRRPGLVEMLVQEFSLSSSEGIALMCMAEALLRIPDSVTRDALIEDKIGNGDWLAHISRDRPIFTNAAAWGLAVTGELVGRRDEKNLKNTLLDLVSRSSKPLIRRAVDTAMRLMGEQFVLGETIELARKNSTELENSGFAYSYDMLGEAAFTAKDASRYRQDYINAIHAIGRSAKGSGVYERPGISIKLSALHPRYVRAQYDRVMAELFPVVKELVLLAREYDIGVSIDAEESERLDISLDLLEALCHVPELNGWHGIGFVVQAYGKRCPFVLDYMIDLARRSKHRLMIRLVKGAYWDSEIKKAQIDGQSDFPVYTRKCHTDISYLACARKLLGARDAVFPQFATHNARTLASIYALAGKKFETGSYEFQCLHGMGEPLYKQITGSAELKRPVRIYAPVGTHETLLAYLVRRLLENGANSSFVNQVGDETLSVASLIEDPIVTAQRFEPYGAPHSEISKPANLFLPQRRNSSGMDLADDRVLSELAGGLKAAPKSWKAAPVVFKQRSRSKARPVVNPALHSDTVGTVAYATPLLVSKAVSIAEQARQEWAETLPAQRADIFDKAADQLERQHYELLSLLSREAGKSLSNGIAEIREAVDFLRYYGALIRRDFDNATHKPLGCVVCISPWNFPLAIFIGQIAAALAAGNVVLAKPAEETPLIAAVAVEILHKAGVPHTALQLLTGDGDTGAALVADEHVSGVMFTGSTVVAQLINRQLEKRRTYTGQPVPFIAETGGQNAMIVDTSALAEQVVADVIASAFDSAGQRCSALRLLCVQEECAEHILTMLRGAMNELRLGNPSHLSTDVGPVITAEAAENIYQHIESFRQKGASVFSVSLPEHCSEGHFVQPTLIEVKAVKEMGGEVFGPVLHVLRYKQNKLDQLLDEINATGYGLTFGLHTRIESTVQRVLSRIHAGNLYVNRNTIGAVVGVQPFGGHGLSGTGPKAGGPLILRRLVAQAPEMTWTLSAQKSAVMQAWTDWLLSEKETRCVGVALSLGRAGVAGAESVLSGPAGEKNIYRLLPKGAVLCSPATKTGLYNQLSLAFSGGNDVVLLADSSVSGWLATLPLLVQNAVTLVAGALEKPCAVLLSERDDEAFENARTALAEGGGPVIPAWITGENLPPAESVIEEQSLSINISAAGGNASLMTLS